MVKFEDVTGTRALGDRKETVFSLRRKLDIGQRLMHKGSGWVLMGRSVGDEGRFPRTRGEDTASAAGGVVECTLGGIDTVAASM